MNPEYAFPRPISIADSKLAHAQHGLTKREYFAAMAMQGILSNNNGIGAIETIAQVVASDSIAIADELLKQLEL
jgi:hypothetical protein